MRIIVTITRAVWSSTASPSATRIRPRVGALAAAWVRDMKSPNRSTPMPPMSTNAEPTMKSRPLTTCISHPSFR